MFYTVLSEKKSRVFLPVPVSRVEIVTGFSVKGSRAPPPPINTEKLLTQKQRVPVESVKVWTSSESLGGAVIQLWKGQYLAF